MHHHQSVFVRVLSGSSGYEPSIHYLSCLYNTSFFRFHWIGFDSFHLNEEPETVMSDQNNINMNPNPHHEEQQQRQPTQEEVDALWKQARTQPDALVHQGSGLPEGSIKLSMMDIKLSGEKNWLQWRDEVKAILTSKSLMSVIDDE